MLLVGLGNPGKEYEGTRHNVGAMVVARIANQLDLTLAEQAKLFALIGKTGETIFAIPTTFMNNSGQAVAAIAHYYKLALDQIVLIHDDLDVPLGEVRIKFGGGTAGHNGVASVAHHLQTPDFWRIRVGIGPSDMTLQTFRTNDTSGFVLAPFHTAELPVVDQVINMVCSTLTDGRFEPSERTMRVETQKGPDGEIESK